MLHLSPTRAVTLLLVIVLIFGVFQYLGEEQQDVRQLRRTRRHALSWAHMPSRSRAARPRFARHHTDLPIKMPHVVRPMLKIRHISLADIDQAAKQADALILREIEKELKQMRPGKVQRHSSKQSLQRTLMNLDEFDPVEFKLAKGGFLTLITSEIIKNKFKLTKLQARDGLHDYSIEHTDQKANCIKEPYCGQSKYRTLDGSCNNLRHPLWAKSETAYERLLPPEYEDGLNEPRIKSKTGRPLPSARLISLHSATERNRPEQLYTLMMMQWGQFIAHDLSLAFTTRAFTGKSLACCDANQRPVQHHACFPITIPENDPFYSKFKQRCMHMVRNGPVPRGECSLGHREQMNIVTHLLDGSMVYGSSVGQMNQIRTFRDGKLKISSVNREEFLPKNAGNFSADCGISEHDQLHNFKCFEAGDLRVNQHTGITMLHNLMIREHNRVARRLKKMHLNEARWNDEILFQEARRIVVAQLQHITYNEWLPIVLGPKIMKLFGIVLNEQIHGHAHHDHHHGNNYDPNVNPNIMNEFATAAYRLHSLIQGNIPMMNKAGQTRHNLKLHSLFNNPKSLYFPNGFDHYLNGFCTKPSQTFDKFFSEEITNHLFEEPDAGFGLDLIAINIQRGRDHGLPGYNAYRKLCGQRAGRSFKDLSGVMQPESAAMFSKLYSDVDDIDLFIGGAHELPYTHALIGPTFACIVAEQMRRSKLGDRYWYENTGFPHSFTQQQISEIGKTSLAALICANTETITKIQPLAFHQPGGFNEKAACKDISRMNLRAWKNEKLW